MTPFMERVAEAVTGGEQGGSPGTRPSEPRPVVIGADEQVMTRALAEQLVSEANAVLVSAGPGAAGPGAAGPGAAGDVIDLEDELGEGRLSFVMRYQERYARVSTSFAHRTSVGRLHGVGADGAGLNGAGLNGAGPGGADRAGAGEIALDGPEQLERLILLLLTQGQGGTSCNTSSASR
jgi:hypothetical protein